MLDGGKRDLSQARVRSTHLWGYWSGSWKILLAVPLGIPWLLAGALVPKWSPFSTFSTFRHFWASFSCSVIPVKVKLRNHLEMKKPKPSSRAPWESRLVFLLPQRIFVVSLLWRTPTRLNLMQHIWQTRLWWDCGFVTRWSDTGWESPQKLHLEQKGQTQKGEKTAVMVAWNKKIYQPNERLWGGKYHIKEQQNHSAVPWGSGTALPERERPSRLEKQDKMKEFIQ